MSHRCETTRLSGWGKLLNVGVKLGDDLEERCKKYGVELRVIDRFYPSSKMCHKCGMIKSDLKLSDRTYKCECGNIIDRDYQASINIRDCGSYKVA